MIDHRGFTIEPKRDFGPAGFLLDGRFVKVGYVVVKNGCNAMPGAVWFRTIRAKAGRPSGSSSSLCARSTISSPSTAG